MRVGGAGCSLVEDGCVGVAVLLDDGHDQHDEFRPEVQVLDAGALLLQGNLLLVLVSVEGMRSEVKLSSAPLSLNPPRGRRTHRVGRLVLLAVELVVVVEDVVVGGVEAGLDAVPHHLAGPGRRLELLDLQRHTKAGAHTQAQGEGAMVVAVKLSPSS